MDKIESDRIIIRFKIPYPAILNHIERYTTFYNSFLSSFQDSALLLEIKDQSIIYFYRDMESAKKIIQLGDIDEKKISQGQNNIITHSMMTAIFPPSIMPLQGITIEIQIIRGNPSELIEMTQNYIKSLSSEIQIKNINENTIKIYIPSYAIIVKYMKTLILKYIEGRIPVEQIPGVT
jgi:hypothetical protein